MIIFYSIEDTKYITLNSQLCTLQHNLQENIENTNTGIKQPAQEVQALILMEHDLFRPRPLPGANAKRRWIHISKHIKGLLAGTWLYIISFSSRP